MHSTQEPAMNNLHRIAVGVSGLVLGAGIAMLAPREAALIDTGVPSASEAFQSAANTRPAAEGNVQDMTYSPPLDYPGAPMSANTNQETRLNSSELFAAWLIVIAASAGMNVESSTQAVRIAYHAE
jgi:hypothetical protein